VSIKNQGAGIMVRRDGAQARKERINIIAQSIQAALFQNKEAGFIPLRKTVAKLMLETGLTREKIMEYLGLLQEADQFELDAEKDQIRKVTV
jgi:hypothetical protein